MSYKYEIILHWSNKDNCYIAEIPELKGCLAHGNTEFEALENINQAKELWIQTAKEFGDEIPAPKGRLIFA